MRGKNAKKMQVNAVALFTEGGYPKLGRRGCPNPADPRGGGRVGGGPTQKKLPAPSAPVFFLSPGAFGAGVGQSGWVPFWVWVPYPPPGESESSGSEWVPQPRGPPGGRPSTKKSYGCDMSNTKRDYNLKVTNNERILSH